MSGQRDARINRGFVDGNRRTISMNEIKTKDK